MFEYLQLVRVTPRSRSAEPFLGWIVTSRPIGLRDVPAMGLYYFVIAPGWRGTISADRLTALTERPQLPSSGLNRRDDVELEP